MLDSLEQLQDWETYKTFLKTQLKQLSADLDQPIYVSKEKLDFKLLGKAWAGHAVLAGPKALAAIQGLRKDGVLFREAACRWQESLLRVDGLAPKLGKEVTKTLQKLKLGVRVALDGVIQDGESEDGAAGSSSDLEAAWKKLKASLTPKVRPALSAGGADASRVQALLGQAAAAEKSGNYAGAMEAFQQLSPLLAAATPSGAEGGPDFIDQAIEDAIGDPEERIKALAEWKVPRYSEEYKNDTPEIQFLEDMESGTKKANEYVGYIEEALDYYEKYGDLAGLGKAGEAAQGLKKITGQLSGGLKKVGKAINGVKNLAVWLVALDRFAEASRAIDPKDRGSVKDWVDTVGGLYDATAPFLEWVQSKALTAALSGSSAAGAVGATLPIVTAQFFVGLKTLQEGVKNVDAYMDRLEKWQKIADEAEHGPPSKPPPPSYPGAWKTREEEARDAVARENAELRQRVQADRQRKRQDATQEFDEKVFPSIYLQGRAGIKRKILDAIRQAGSKTYSPGDVLESDWWECLLSASGDAVFDEKAGVYIQPKLDSVTADGARQEIDEFQNLSRPCPYFKELYDRARKAHLSKTLVK